MSLPRFSHELVYGAVWKLPRSRWPWIGFPAGLRTCSGDPRASCEPASVTCGACSSAAPLREGAGHAAVPVLPRNG